MEERKYETYKGTEGFLLTVCPIFNNPLIKVGSGFCQDCDNFVSKNIVKKIVVCKAKCK